jgi:hypothetical protein
LRVLQAKKEPTSGLEPLTCSLRVSVSYWTSNPLYTSSPLGSSIGPFPRSRPALSAGTFYRISGGSASRPRLLRSRWPASPSRNCPWGGRGAFLPRGGDCEPRHCQCGWCDIHHLRFLTWTAAVVPASTPIGGDHQNNSRGSELRASYQYLPARSMRKRAPAPHKAEARRQDEQFSNRVPNLLPNPRVQHPTGRVLSLLSETITKLLGA